MTVKKGSVELPVFENFDEVAEYIGRLRGILKAARFIRNTRLGFPNEITVCNTQPSDYEKVLEGIWIAVPSEDFDKLRQLIKEFDQYGYV